MKKTLSIMMAVIMLITIIPASVFAGTDYKDLLLQGLADPTAKKATEKYDGYKFVKGSKITWDCKLYTLTAKVSKVSGSDVTFDINFSSKIPSSYMGSAEYYIDIGTSYFKQGAKMQYTLDTSEAHEGMNFLKIKVEKREILSEYLYSDSKYYQAIRKNRETHPDSTNYIDTCWIEDVYYLSYYDKPDVNLNTDYFKVSKKSISLGKYTFATVILHRKKGEKKWKETAFAANKEIVFKGLKPGTVYEFTPLFSLPFDDPETGQKKKVVDKLGKPFYLVTVFNKKPKISSVKVTKIKFGKRNMAGYWETHSDGRLAWHPAETFNTATYTVKVKVKNAPKGIKGLYMKSGSVGYFKKGKKTYTFKMYYQDKKSLKGKKMSFKFAYASNSFGNKAIGIGPSKTVKYKLKKGTYK